MTRTYRWASALQQFISLYSILFKLIIIVYNLFSAGKHIALEIGTLNAVKKYVFCLACAITAFESSGAIFYNSSGQVVGKTSDPGTF